MFQEEIIKIPIAIEQKLAENKELMAITYCTISEFALILKLNDRPLHREYTDHGILHVEKILECAEKLIEKNTFSKLSSMDIAVLIMSTVLHDIAMQLPISTFRKMLQGEYDSALLDNSFESKTWKELWKDYILETRHYGPSQKENHFGDKSYKIMIIFRFTFQAVKQLDLLQGKLCPLRIILQCLLKLTSCMSPTA